MLNETQKYVLTLTEQDAKQICANAKMQGGIDGVFWKKTETYYAYQAAIEAIRELCRQREPETYSFPYEPKKNSAPLINIETLKFVHYVHKLETAGYRNNWPEGTM